MQIESNQSKPLFGLLPRWMHCGFESSISFQMCSQRLNYILVLSELLLLCIILVILGCFACFSPQHVASQIVCERRSFISSCMDWQTYQRCGEGGGIISAVAEGCREVVWHRHWLSLLRSEGIARLRKKRERKGAKWVSKWTILQIGLDEMQVSCGCALFIYFIFLPHLVQVEPAISHAFLTPDRQEMVVVVVVGGYKQITDCREEARMRLCLIVC